MDVSKIKYTSHEIVEEGRERQYTQNIYPADVSRWRRRKRLLTIHLLFQEIFDKFYYSIKLYNSITISIIFRHILLYILIIASRDEERTKEGLTNNSLKFWKRPTSVAPEMAKDPFSICLEEFSHIDYRNCQCDSVISHLFWRLHRHIGNCGKVINLIV